MAAGQLYISANGGTEQDAWTTWGVGLEDGSLAELMAPLALKAPVVNESRLENGKRYIVEDSPKVDERVVTLVFYLIAGNVSEYITNYRAFISTLAGGNITLRTAHEPTVYYHLIYGSSTQFRQFFGGLAKIAVKFIEPNPANRTNT